MSICICGIQAAYHCTSCFPNVLLCVNCIGIHLNDNLEDCIKPLKAKNPESNMCELCGTEKAVKLGVFEDCTQRLCRFCKASADLYIDLKWESLISKTSDLGALTQRRSILKRLQREFDENKSENLIKSSIQTIKNELQSLLEQKLLQRQQELLSLSSSSQQDFQKLKKDLTDLCFKRDITETTDAGRILSNLIFKSYLDLSAYSPKLLTPDLKQLDSSLTKFVSGIKLVENESQERFVYLFTPGKNVLVKVKLSELKKSEILFDKNWNFEASWCLLDNGDVFLCGGNGRDSSEVLLITSNPANVRQLHGFSGRSGHSAVQVDGDVYVFGGNKGNFTEKYVFGEDRWNVLTDLPQKIQRVSSCVIGDGVLSTGSECDKLWLYQITENCYSQIDFPLSGYSLRNKIIFFTNNTLYCLTGDRLILYNWEKKLVLLDTVINDRDWWSYSSPIIYKNCAFFIKYFVRNLWKINLDTLKMIEIPINSLN